MSVATVFFRKKNIFASQNNTKLNLFDQYSRNVGLTILDYLTLLDVKQNTQYLYEKIKYHIALDVSMFNLIKCFHKIDS